MGVNRIRCFAYQFVVSAHEVRSRLSFPHSREMRCSQINFCFALELTRDYLSACCSPTRAAQDSNVFFRSFRGYVSQISVGGMLEFLAVSKSNPLLSRAAANELKAAGTRSRSSKCISMRLMGLEPSVPTTRTLLIAAPAPNTLRAISPGKACLPADAVERAGVSVFRRIGNDDAGPWPLALRRTSNRHSGPCRR